MKLHQLLVTGLLGAALVAAAGAAARPGGHGPGGPGGPGELETQIGALDLDVETENSVYAVLDALRDDQRELRRQMRPAHQRMRELLGAEAPDEEAILAQADAIAALHSQARKQHLRALLTIIDLVPGDARDALRESLQRRPARRHRGSPPHDT